MCEGVHTPQIFCVVQGLPLGADSIAAGIVAEAVQRGRLALPAVEARLGPTVARLLADILEVRHAVCAGTRGQQLAVAKAAIGPAGGSSWSADRLLNMLMLSTSMQGDDHHTGVRR